MQKVKKGIQVRRTLVTLLTVILSFILMNSPSQFGIPVNAQRSGLQAVITSVTTTPSPTATPMNPPGRMRLRLCASADTLLQHQNPTQLFGNSRTLATGYRSGDDFQPVTSIWRSLLRFRLPWIRPGSSQPGPLIAAGVELFGKGGSGQNSVSLELHPVTRPWNESSVTWSSQPSASHTLLTSTFGTADGYSGWGAAGVSANELVNAAVGNGLLVRGSESGQQWYRSFSSREGAQPPRLVLDYAVVGTTDTTLIPADAFIPSGRPTITLGLTSVESGTEFTIRGQGFNPPQGVRRIAIYWDEVVTSNLMTTAAAALDGTFIAEATVPSNAVPGSHVVLVREEYTGVVDTINANLLAEAQAPMRVERWCDPPGQNPLPNTSPSITLSPSAGPLGGGNQVRIDGINFVPGSSVDLLFNGLEACTGGPGACLGNARAGSDGRFRQVITIPSSGSGIGGESIIYARRLPANVDPVQLAAADYYGSQAAPPPAGDTRAPDVSISERLYRQQNDGIVFGASFSATANDPITDPARPSNGVVSLTVIAVPIGVVPPYFYPTITCTQRNSLGTNPMQCSADTPTPFVPGLQGMMYWAQATDRSGNTTTTPVKQVSFTRENVTFYNFGLGLPAIEVNQSIQRIGNPVPLLSGKPALIRVYPVSTFGPLSNVTAQLTATLDGTPLPVFPVGPGNPVNGIAIQPQTQFQRTNLQQSFNFQINIPPITATSATLNLQAKLDPSDVVRETNENDNTSSLSVNVYRGPTLWLELFGLQYVNQSGMAVQPSQTDYAMLESWLRQAYPISSLSSFRRGLLIWQSNQPPTDDDVDDINDVLDSLRDQDLEQGRVPRRARYYAMISDNNGNFVRGSASGVPSNSATGPTGQGFNGDTDASYGDWYGGHEIAHMLGRKHVFCRGDEESLDTSYPYPKGDLGGINGALGFDPQTFLGQGLMTAPKWKDVMSYCPNQWVSEYTFLGLLSELRNDEPVAVSRVIADQPTPISGESGMVAGDFLRVAGRIRFDTDTVTLYPFWRHHLVLPEALSSDGTWSVRLHAVDGRLIATYPFEPQPSSDSDPAHPSNHFSLMIPFRSEAARISIWHREQERGSRMVSRHLPVIKVLSPKLADRVGNKLFTIRWKASDEDSDALTFRLLYSTDDGQTWHGISAPIKSLREVNINSADLPGSNKARVRVEVTDGIHVAYADSAPFSVARKPPRVSIVSGVGVGRISANAPFGVQAVMHDVEDDHRSQPLKVEWFLDGRRIGTYHTMVVPGLAHGRHKLEVIVRDSDGNKSSSFLSLTVAQDR